MDINTILFSLGVGVAGYFLRDIYNYSKKKFFKGSSPKTSLKYEFRHRATGGTNPRRYTFISELTFKNIDTIPIYDVELFLIRDGGKRKIKECEYLGPNCEIRKAEERIVNYQVQGNYPDEAQKLLLSEFTNPNILVTFRNKDGHRFRKTNGT